MSTSYSDTLEMSIPALRGELDGALILPDDAGYDEARTVFYSGIDRRPAAIIRAAHAADVARVVSLARTTGLELAVRSGGHSIAGHSVCDDGIVLDLSAMRGLEIDAEQGTAWAETGLTAGEYTAAVGAHGLATGFGDAPSVGIGGITLGGGVGFLHRKYGLTIDSLLAAEIVTADGQLLRADADTHPELFWAIRGGGGNFGVATRFQYRLHEVDSILGGMLILPATPATIVGFVAEAAAAPEELTAIAMVMPAPPMPFIAAEHHGKPIVMAIIVYAGDVDAGQRALAPLRALAKPIADLMRPMRYREIYDQEGEAPHPAAVTVQTMFVDGIDRGAAETILDQLQRGTAPMRVAQIRVLGGAVDRVPADATAFAHRGRLAIVNVAAAFDNLEDATQHDAWAAAFAAQLRNGQPGAYVGFLGDDGPERIRDAYPGVTWERLAKVKAQYDPTNLFRRNLNIRPA